MAQALLQSKSLLLRQGSGPYIQDRLGLATAAAHTLSSMYPPITASSSHTKRERRIDSCGNASIRLEQPLHFQTLNYSRTTGFASDNRSGYTEFHSAGAITIADESAGGSYLVSEDRHFGSRNYSIGETLVTNENINVGNGGEEEGEEEEEEEEGENEAEGDNVDDTYLDDGSQLFNYEKDDGIFSSTRKGIGKSYMSDHTLV